MNFRGAAAFATEVTLTGRFLTAEEALAAGIINRVAPEGRHLEVAHELAAEVAKNRHSRCAQPSAAAAGIWISSSARLQCRPPP